MDMDRRLQEDECESGSGSGASDGDGETGVSIVPGKFELLAGTVSGTVTIKPKE
jgi:hypothetical protein